MVYIVLLFLINCRMKVLISLKKKLLTPNFEMLVYRPYVAPPLFSTAFVVFCLPFVFPLHEGKFVRIYE